MKLPTWKKIDRKRKIDIRYTDPGFNDYYDIDIEDFQNMVMKLKSNTRLNYVENERYGKYILTICLIVLEGPKFKKKLNCEKEEIIEQQYYELLNGITTFNPNKGKIYSYAYRIAYTAVCHYYTNRAEEAKRNGEIVKHCNEELDDYYEEYDDHKVPRH